MQYFIIFSLGTIFGFLIFAIIRQPTDTKCLCEPITTDDAERLKEIHREFYQQLKDNSKEDA